MATLTPKVAALVVGAVLFCLASVITPFLLFSPSTKTTNNNLGVDGSRNSLLPQQLLPPKTAVLNSSNRPAVIMETLTKLRGFLSLYMTPVVIAAGAIILVVVGSLITIVVLQKNSASVAPTENLVAVIKPEEETDRKSEDELANGSSIPILKVAAFASLSILWVMYAIYMAHLTGCRGEPIREKTRYDTFWEELAKFPKREYSSCFKIGPRTLGPVSGVYSYDLAFGQASLILLHNLPDASKGGPFSLKFIRKPNAVKDLRVDKFGLGCAVIFDNFNIEIDAECDKQITYLLEAVKDLNTFYDRIQAVKIPVKNAGSDCD